MNFRIFSIQNTKDRALEQASELGHKMTRVSPERYECTACEASVFADSGSNWHSFKIGTFCSSTKFPTNKEILADLVCQ